MVGRIGADRKGFRHRAVHRGGHDRVGLVRPQMGCGGAVNIGVCIQGVSAWKKIRAGSDSGKAGPKAAYVLTAWLDGTVVTALVVYLKDPVLARVVTIRYRAVRGG